MLFRSELIADRIENGATIQLGIGNLPNAISEKLTDKKDLGVHTEMLTPSLINLYKKGVITGRKKTIHRDKMIAAFCIGTQDDYGFLHNNPAVEFHTTTYVNHPKVIAKNKNLVSVNNAISVDLTGQVASESIGFRQYSGTGGQLDFVRGAKYSEGGMSFIALKSTLDKSDYKKSRIVSFFPPGTVVTTPRADVQMIVTEYGIADLRNKTIPERVNQMISIAHPDFKEALAKEAVDSGLIPAGMIQEI